LKRRIVFFQRNSRGGFSLEKAFEDVRSALPSDCEVVGRICRFESKGLFRRLYNLVEASFRQGDVNHIAGDVHFLSYMMSKERTVLTVADLVYRRNTKGLKRWIIELLWYVIPIRRVSVVTVISEWTKLELLKHIKCAPSKVKVIPVSVSAKYKFVPKIFCSECPKILQIGTSPNKNLPRLFEALKGVSCHLCIVGSISEEQKALLGHFELKWSNYVGLTEEELIGIYEESDLVSFVSTYEGFGVPIIEANAIGRPVITAGVASMPEVAGDAACIVDPENVMEIRSGILRIIQDEVYRNQLIANGLRNRERFRSEHVARQYYDIYNSISVRAN